MVTHPVSHNARTHTSADGCVYQRNNENEFSRLFCARIQLKNEKQNANQLRNNNNKQNDKLAIKNFCRLVKSVKVCALCASAHAMAYVMSTTFPTVSGVPQSYLTHLVNPIFVIIIIIKSFTCRCHQSSKNRSRFHADSR